MFALGNPLVHFYKNDLIRKGTLPAPGSLLMPYPNWPLLVPGAQFEPIHVVIRARHCLNGVRSAPKYPETQLSATKGFATK